jgi:tRNA 2-selenouridine synthase
MPLQTLPASTAMAQLSRFDAVIDARSEGEYALDHLPGAQNWPSLNNEERITIGTLYKQVNPFEAKKRGAALVARNIARHIETRALDHPKHWKPLVYCWRGGNRSGALATILSAIGFHVTLIEGGYKAWRQAVLEDTPQQVARLHFRVVCGPTGSGKTRLLHALARAGAQVLDLEDLAQHRSSVLGLVPGQAQPSQKRFDGLVWQALQGFDANQPVYVESESKKVGNLRVPDSLMDAMRASPCLDLQLAEAERVQLLLEDYPFFSQDPAFFAQRLQALTELRGREVVGAWVQAIQEGRTEDVVRDLLLSHYDPLYAASIRRNFSRYHEAVACTLPDRSTAALDQLAQAMVAKA